MQSLAHSKGSILPAEVCFMSDAEDSLEAFAYTSKRVLVWVVTGGLVVEVVGIVVVAFVVVV